jgi:2'-5' RNA ligase
MPAFSLSCDQITDFGNRARPALVLTCGHGKSEIETLRGKLADHILRAGFRSKIGFTPHVTIACAQEPFAEKIDRFHGQGRHEHLKHWLLTG